MGDEYTAEGGTPEQTPEPTQAPAGSEGGTPGYAGGAPEGESPASGQMGSDPQAAPSHVSETAFNEYVASQSEQWNEFTNKFYDYLDQFGKGVEQKLMGFSRQTPTQTQTQSKSQGFPDYREFRERVLNDDYELYNSLMGNHKQVQDALNKINQRVESLARETKIRENSQQWYNYMDGLIKQSAKTHPELQDDATRRYFENLVVAHAQSVNGDWRRMNIPKLAKDFVGHMNSYASKKYGQAGPATPGQNPEGQPPIPPSMPGGAPSIPGKKERPMETLEDFEMAQDEALPFFAEMGKKAYYPGSSD